MKKILLITFFSFLLTVGASAQKKGRCYVDDPKIRGEYKGGCQDGEAHGKGKASGDWEYKGEFVHGKKEGEGVLVAPEYFEYKGAFLDDLYEGMGLYKEKSGFQYEGMYKAGKKSGEGEAKWPNKDYYVGEWANDKRDGEGTLKGGDKSLYVGRWKNGLQHGKGKMTYADKSYYEGEWKEGKFDGHGERVYPEGQTYEGKWRAGMRDGSGKYIISGKKKAILYQYTGEWKGDMKEGNGKMVFMGLKKNPGYVYEGDWLADKKSGYGELKSNDGYMYKGQWLNDMKHGKGEYIFPSGTRFVGEFVAGEMTGQGIKYYDGGKDVKAGVWENGQIISEAPEAEISSYLNEHYKNVGATVSKGNLKPPYLEASNISFADVYKNAQTYQNNFIDVNEECRINFVIANSGSGSAKDVIVKVKEKSYLSGLKFEEEIEIGNIPAGLQKKVSIPLKSDYDLESGTANFSIEIIEANGFDADPISLKVATKGFQKPILKVAEYYFESESGSSVELGKPVKLVAVIENKGQGFAEGVKMDFIVPANVFITGESSFNLGNLESGARKEVVLRFVPNKRYDKETLMVTASLKESLGKFGATEGLSLNIARGTGGTAVSLLSADIDNDLPTSKTYNPDAIAVVIGNRDYKETQQVAYAVNDARSIKKYLIEVLGFKEGNVIYKENATKSDFETLFGVEGNPRGKLYNAVKPNISDVFVFYAGHGAPSLKQKENYFVPVECDPHYIELNGYPMYLFNNNLKKLPAKSLTIVLDACFSGANIFKGVSGFKPVAREENTVPNSILLSSSTGDQVSSWYGEKKHGMFTYFFLKGLHSQEADANKDKEITYREMFEYLSSKSDGVPYYARKLNGVEQDPTIEGDNLDRVLFKY